jgi:hypothetical protein
MRGLRVDALFFRQRPPRNARSPPPQELATDDERRRRRSADRLGSTPWEAAGEISTAEGIHSLARAFAYAGAKSVVGTLWKVEDRSATRFVKEMAAGDPAVGMAFMTIVVAAAGFWIRLH